MYFNISNDVFTAIEFHYTLNHRGRDKASRFGDGDFGQTNYLLHILGFSSKAVLKALAALELRKDDALQEIASHLKQILLPPPRNMIRSLYLPLGC